MAGTGSNSTAEALRLTKLAAKAGADAALMVGPYYNKPTQEGFYRHFKAVAEAGRHSDLRLQHPRPHRQEHRARDDRPHGRTAEHHAGQGSDRLARPGVADPGTTDLTVLSGDDSLTLPLMAIGGEA